MRIHKGPKRFSYFSFTVKEVGKTQNLNSYKDLYGFSEVAIAGKLK